MLVLDPIISPRVCYAFFDIENDASAAPNIKVVEEIL